VSAENLATQAAAATCLAGLAVGHPKLPAAFITISQHMPGELKVQLDSPSEVEAWREALGVDADLVRVGRLGERAALRFDARVYGVDFHVYAAYEQAATEAGAA
jgi:hypothetical protein